MNTDKSKFIKPTRNDFLKEIVHPMVARRKELGMTQEDLDHRLGVSDRLVSKWECGTRSPTSFNLLCWAQALDGLIFFGTKPDQIKPNANDNHNSCNVSNDNQKVNSWEEILRKSKKLQ